MPAKGKGKRSVRNPSKQFSTAIGKLPLINATPVHRQKIRFTQIAAGATVNNVTSADLHNLLVICTGAASTTATTIIGSYRIRRVSVFLANSTAATIGNVALIWPSTVSGSGAVGGRSSIKGDCCLGVGTCSVSEAPPRDSMTRFWNGDNTTTVTAFAVKSAGNGIMAVDLDFEYTLINEFGGSAGQAAITAIGPGTGTASVGQLCCTRLDFNGANVLQPQDWTPY